ncbi:ATP-binding cassette domain-containing protein [Propionibacteriaceae bacterium G57]|uniref:ATP-binding cassette domain-containing protein n=1 Tax=Aestuariimicrobium sp. G57 TaxID=3418485 RepID=UPI003DA6E4DA
MLDTLSWHLPTGTTFLLGPNGAGKSTLLSLLATSLTPQHGELLWGSQQLDTKSLPLWRQRVGWIPQRVDPIPGMTSREQVAYAGWLKGLSRRDAWDRAASSLERVHLTGKANERSSQLSGGQLRRLAIACALTHDATVLLMDEPTAGLDPNQRSRLYALVGKLEEVDCLIATHQTEDMGLPEANVAVMDRGRIIHESSWTDFISLGSGAATEERAVSAYRSLIREEE